MRIEELMNKFPATCGPDETLSQAAQKMQDSNCAFLPVTAGDRIPAPGRHDHRWRHQHGAPSFGAGVSRSSE